ncbi:translocation and assembly module TamB [Inhella inkyongensis]|uniref:Translocation and assembly module TamB n=1 Tax=Inhella inkyongensis TaxID=392593 RepID=A0A840S2L9_9BURK|nr:translocation/assembly module TamB domain-containing protein [Inhella inkyongensis]MBB5203648.1 translocation and assembly module TamB [Inhella inkyongensis]
MSSPAKPVLLRKRLIWGLALLTAWLLLGVLLGVLAGTAPVLRALAGPGFESLRGSLWTGLEAEVLEGQGEGEGGLRWRIEKLQLAAPRWRAGQWRLSAHLSRLQLDTGSSSGPPPDASQVLALLRPRLPATLNLEALQIDALQIDGIQAQALQLQARWGQLEAGQWLAIDALRLRWQQRQLQAQGSLSHQGDLRAAATLLPPGATPDWRLQLQAQGPLAAPVLKAQLHRGDGPLGLDAALQLRPFSPHWLHALDVQAQDLNPQSLLPAAPAGAWNGRLQGELKSDGRLALQLRARNSAAQRLDANGLPVHRLHLDAQLPLQQWQALQIQALEIELGSTSTSAGRLSLVQPQALPQAGQPLRADLRLSGLQLQRLDARWPAWQLEGELALQQAAWSEDQPLHWQTRLQAQGQGQRLSAQGRGQLKGRQIAVSDLQLSQAEGGRAQAQGDWDLSRARGQWQLQLESLRLPLPPWPKPSLLSGRLDGQVGRGPSGQWLGALQLALSAGSQLGGSPLQGQAELKLEPQQSPWQLALQLQGGQGLHAQGDGPALPLGLQTPMDWLPRQADWQLNDLAALKPLWQPWLSRLEGQTQGRWQQDEQGRPAVQLRAEGLRWQQGDHQQDKGGRLRQLQLQWQPEGQLEAELAQLEWQGQRLSSLQLQGSRSQPWQLKAQGPWQGQDWTLEAQSAALQRSDDAPQHWLWPELRLQLKSSLAQPSATLALVSPALSWQQGRLQLQAGQLELAGERLDLQQAEVTTAGDWTLRLGGAARLAPWLNLLGQTQSGPTNWSGAARLRLALDLHGDAQHPPQGRLSLSALQGELSLDGQALGLQALSLKLEQEAAGRSALGFELRSTLLGQVLANAEVGPSGSVNGQLKADLPRLSALRPWLPPDWRLDGAAQLQAHLSGSRQQPQLHGQLGVQLSSLSHASSGAGGQQGLLRAEFDGQGLQLQELRLQGLGEQGGQISGSGSLRWGDEQPSAQLTLQAEGFRVLNGFERRLVLSGQTELQLGPERLRLRGALRADEGQFTIPRTSQPELDADVKVLNAQAEAPPPRKSNWQRDVELRLNLGERLRVQGRGFASRLTGELLLRERAGQAAQWTGQIDTQGGRYQAYGQTLEIETGSLRFKGPLNDPRVDLLAIKPGIEHRVGVSVTGTALQPRVRLVAEPELPDNDKLAWLLLGREPGTEGGRDAALLQQAALALLAGEEGSGTGQVLQRLGLSEFSVGQDEDAATVLRVGAQLSKHWSLGYERSLSAAAGQWQLTYRLGQRFRLRAQSGLESAVDLLWLWKFD